MPGLQSSFPARLRNALAMWLAMMLLVCQGVLPECRADESDQSAKQTEETWQVVYIGNPRVGYGRSSTATETREGREVVVTNTEMSMSLKRFGQAITTRVVLETEETAEGDLLSFRFELQNPPAAAQKSSGRVENGRLLLETETAGKVRKNAIAWDASIKSPAYHDRMLRQNPLKPGEKRVLESFSPEFARRNRITLEARDYENVDLLGRRKQRLLRIDVSESVAPGIVLSEFVDESGEALKTSTGLLQMATYKVSREEALKEISGEEVDLAVATLVKTNPLKDPRATRRVVYRIRTPGEDPAKVVAAGPEHEIARVAPDTIDLTVTAIEPGGTESTDRAPADEYLASNSYIQGDDERVRELAAQAAGSETDPWKAARKMEGWVSENLALKNFSTLLASAAEVAKNLSGDCTEHAVLLAAMARARQIPSRVAVGLVYVPRDQSFGGHMWTEVFVSGKWVPLDATLGDGRVAADHIKFADSSFSENGAVAPLSAFLPLVATLGKMHIEVRDVEHDAR